MDEQPLHEQRLSELGFLRRLFAWQGIWNHWVILLSGLASIILGAINAFKDKPLPSWTFWTAAGVCLVIAGFRAAFLLYKRADNRRKKNEDEVIDATMTKFVLDDRPALDERNGAVSVRVACVFGGGAKNCGVTWHESVPPVRAYPVPLHCGGEARPHSGKVNMNAGEARLFNVARINPDTGTVELVGAGHEDVFPIDPPYRVTLRAHAADMPAYQDKDFILDMGRDGLVFYPVLNGDPERNEPRRMIPPEFEEGSG